MPFVDVTVPAGEGAAFGPRCFDSALGREVTFGASRGVLRAAYVRPGGLAAVLRLEVDELPAAAELASGDLSVVEDEFDEVPVEDCPDPGCEGDHYWQPAAYRRSGWVSYRSPVRRVTHRNLRLCGRSGRLHPDRFARPEHWDR